MWGGEGPDIGTYQNLIVSFWCHHRGVESPRSTQKCWKFEFLRSFWWAADTNRQNSPFTEKSTRRFLGETTSRRVRIGYSVKSLLIVLHCRLCINFTMKLSACVIAIAIIALLAVSTHAGITPGNRKTRGSAPLETFYNFDVPALTASAMKAGHQ